MPAANSNFSVKNGLVVNGDLIVAQSGQVSVNGDLSVSGSANLQGNVAIAGVLVLGEDVEVTGNGSFSSVQAAVVSVGNSTVNTVVNSTSVNTASIHATSNLSVGANVLANTTAFKVGNTVLGDGVSNVSGNVGVSGDANVVGRITASGNASFANGFLTVTANSTVKSATFGVGNVAFDTNVLYIDSVNGRIGIGNTTPDAALTVSGTANVQGNMRVVGDLTVTGNTVSVGTQVANGDIIPQANGFHLGNTSNRWDVVANSAVFGNVSISANNTTFGNTEVAYLRFRSYGEKATTNTVTGSTYTLDLSLTNNFDVTLGNNVTITANNAPPSGTWFPFTLILRQDGTGGRTVTWAAPFKFPNGSAPSLSANAAAVDVFSFFTTDQANNVYGGLALGNVK